MSDIPDGVRTMRITTAEFIRTRLDRSFAELDDAAKLAEEGRVAEAEHAYAEFVRAKLDPERFFSKPYPGQENVWKKALEIDREIYERMQRGAVMSCNYLHEFGPDGIQWEANPTPNKYAEWTWQLNRHHEFIALARLYRETGDETIPYFFVKLWRSWREQCDCPYDASGITTLAFRTIEIGIRMRYSWHCALHAFYRSPAFTDHDICDYFASMWENADRLRRLHRPVGNWLFMEMAGLFVTGLLYPWISDAQGWKQYALDVLAGEVEKQLYPDGFHVELSTGYHSVVVFNTLDVISFANLMGEPVLGRLAEALAPAFDLYIKLGDPTLHTPDLNDGTRADVSKECRTALGVFPDRPDYKYFATKRAEGKPPEYVNTYMPYSGIAVFRDDWSSDSQWAFFDGGPFGLGHQHEDKLNFLLYAYGKELLCDTGNYAYSRSLMRAFVLSAASHNTVMVDGNGQNRRGKYRWHDGDLNKLSGLEVKFGDGFDIAEAVYDEGFGPEYIDVTHKRTVVKVKNRPLGLKTFYLIIDRLTSNDGKPHAYAARWQLEAVPYLMRTGLDKTAGRPENFIPEYAAPRRLGSVISADYGDGVTLTLASGENATVICGSMSPFAGWRTPDTPAPAVDFTAFGEAARIVTLIYPSDEGCPVRSVEYTQDNMSGPVTVRLSDGREWVFEEQLVDERLNKE
ncbi:MAG: alginate lyase family protein [Clostridia bacterium]|nr:alginate lyase family protein [Clostridia bacterium]